MDTPVRVRAADRDRDRAISRLSDDYAAGRLDFAEFSDRMERAQVATYLDELSPLFADLPRTPDTVVRRKPERRPGRRHPRANPVLTLSPLLVVAILCLPVLAIVTLAVAFFPFWLPLLALWVFSLRGRGPVRGCSPSRSWHPAPPRSCCVVPGR